MKNKSQVPQEPQTLLEQREAYWNKKKRELTIYSTIFINCIGISFILFIINWKLGLALFLLTIYSEYWFQKGYQSQVVDEYEVGYLRDGLRYLVRSLLGLAVVIGLIVLVYNLII